MDILADFHTHTAYSHGKGSIEDNVLAALARGFKRVAITDHGPGHIFYGVRRKRLPEMRREIDALNEKYAGRIETLLGVELNLLSLDGETDFPGNDLLDIVLMGYHRGVLLRSAASLWSFTAGRNSKEAIECNTHAYRKALERYPVDIVTHPGEYVPVDMRTLARAAVRTGAVIEINSSHEATTVADIVLAKSEGALFAFGSDAHTPSRVGDFELAQRLAGEAGLTANDIVNSDGGGAAIFLERISKQR